MKRKTRDKKQVKGWLTFRQSEDAIHRYLKKVADARDYRDSEGYVPIEERNGFWHPYKQTGE